MIDYSEFINDPAVHIDIGKWLDEKNILVTGGGGSIGSEICRKLLEYPVKKITAIGRSEEPLFRLKKELPDPRLFIRIADILDSRQIRRAVNPDNTDIVFHTAAYKHVGLMERHVVEAVQNNIFGTENLFSIFRGSHFVFVSTDKAVFPTSVMGASKRFCEKYLTTQRNAGANIDIVRLGNVIGSSGSVSEIFEKAAREGKPLVVSNAGMKRFFITPKNAASLIIQAGSLGNRASYVLKMGPEISIMDLAKFIQAHYDFGSDIKVGNPLSVEKITEELFDRPVTEIPGKRLFMLEDETFEWSDINTFIDSFEWAGQNSEILRENLFKSVKS